MVVDAMETSEALAVEVDPVEIKIKKLNQLILDQEPAETSKNKIQKKSRLQ